MTSSGRSIRSILRENCRNFALSVAGLLPIHPGAFEVRFLYGHSITPANRQRFRRTLRLLRRHFEFVSNLDAVQLLRDRNPPSGRYMAFSFDDGFRDNFDLIAPTLDEVGARACFFLVSKFIGCDEIYRRRIIEDRLHCAPDQLPMSWTMVRELQAAGFELGAHTTDHTNLAETPFEEAVRQICVSKHVIETECKAPCRLFAWPYGTLQHFPPALLSVVEHEFEATFSAIRSRELCSFDGAVVNRDHCEPGWPTSHVRYFVGRRKTLFAPVSRGFTGGSVSK